ncbi:MAG: Fic family protein [Candidatus Kerfeldbacteria bacterium]|nr:Fic family protein [Candidatus Kerfeldbacteria bacterium]
MSNIVPKRPGETSYKETAFGIIPRSKLIPLEIEGITKAWDFVLKKKEKGELPLTPSFLKEVHNVGFGWIFPDLGGKYRTIEVKVSKHTPPEHYLITQLMEEFFRDLQTRIRYLPNIDSQHSLDELISLLAWAHHKFLWIHPFQDYNGRMSRLLNNIILLNLDLPPIELKVETTVGRKIYIHALQAADHLDYIELENIIKSAIHEAAQKLHSTK